MILIIGGAFQNKKEWAMTHYDIKTDEVSDLKIDTNINVKGENAKIIDNIQDSIKEKILKNEFSSTMFDEIIAQNPDIILICDEIGSGLVPIDEFDRKYRDKVGETCCYLAKKATTVHRVVCGIGMVVKDA